ncbi:MAG: 50S ribosomal protein L18 [Desulfobacterota bacterium]|nr:50S ribosomal protein L18 [Thermodesulfobacteriota bacterium]MDW8002390.1 50S ribosomal protein L18 [Deltaproteobacteria bacterium]
MERKEKEERRRRRHKRIRKKIFGTAERPRLCVYKSLKHMYAQLVDDESRRVITGVSTLTPSIRSEIKNGGNKEAAKLVGKMIAEKALALGITKVVFDRNGFKYHGRVKALADAAREAGLIF